MRSHFHRAARGVPQGSVISPTLFNYFVSDFPDVAEPSTNYADDFTILESGTDLSVVESRLNDDLFCGEKCKA